MVLEVLQRMAVAATVGVQDDKCCAHPARRLRFAPERPSAVERSHGADSFLAACWSSQVLATVEEDDKPTEP